MSPGPIYLHSDFILPLRHTVRTVLDRHASMSPDGKSWVDVQRDTSRGHCGAPQGRAVFLSREHRAHRELLACVESASQSWWVQCSQLPNGGWHHDIVFGILDMFLGWLVSLGHVSLDGSKFKANSSKHKAMSYGRLKEKEQELCEEIEALTGQADAQDEEEDRAYQERTGYELPEDLRDKKQRLKKVRETKQLLEAREEELRPRQEIEDKKQISFADPEARIMKDKGDFEYAYNAQISVDGKSQVIVGQHVSQQANDSQ